MKRICMLALVVLAVSCSEEREQEPVRSYLTGKVVLAGASDHSGVVVTLGGPQTRIAVTDASGSYAFGELSGGEYVVIASARSTLEGTVAASVTVSGNAEVRAPDLAFTPVGEIAGTVALDGAASGNAGIAVVVAGTAASAATDDTGAFVIRGVPAGSRQVIASRPGYASATATVAVTYGGRASLAQLSLARVRHTGAIQGSATASGAGTSAGIAVTLAGPASGGAVTDATGAYGFGGIPDGDYTVVLVAPSTAEGTRTVRVTVAGGVQAIAPAASFTALGRVVGSARVSPASGGHAGTIVRVPGTAAAAITDEDGAYAIPDVPAGARNVSAQRPGYVTATAAAVEVHWNTEASAPDLVLQKAIAPGGIAGRVVVQGTATSAGVIVTLAGPVTGAATTDATGRYQFSDLPAGSYTVTALVPATVEASRALAVQVAAAVADAADLVFTAVGALSGRVTLAGAQSGNGGVVVSLAGGSVAGITDDAGNYLLANVPAGTYDVLASRAGYLTGTAAGQSVTHATTTAAPALDLAAGGPATGVVAGIATLAGQAGHAGTLAALEGTGLADITLADGAYAIEAVPDGVYTLALSNGEYSERVPGVLSLPGGTGFLSDGTIVPLGTIELARARRVASGSIGGEVVKGAPSSGWVATPDGSRIVSLMAGDLVSAPVAAGEPVTLARNVVSFRVAPTGTAVLYRTYAGDLEAVPVAGGTVHLLGTTQSDPSFTPDGARAIFTSTFQVGNLLHMADYATGAVATLGPASSWSFSPDGEYLLLWDATAATLSSASVAGGAVSMLAAQVIHWGFAPGGTRVLVLSNRDPELSTATLAKVPVSGGEAAVLATDAFGVWQTSPDGTKIVFMRRDAAGVSVQVNAIADGALLFSAANAQAPMFSADSAHVIYRGWTTSMLHEVPAGGGTPTALTTALQYGPVLSPTGAYVLFTELANTPEGSVWTARVVDLATRETASSYSAPAGVILYTLQFSPTSARAYAYHYNSTMGYYSILALSSSGGVGVRIADATYPWWGPTGFAPNGSHLVFWDCTPSGWAVKSHSVADDAVATLWDGLSSGFTPFSITPDSSRVVLQWGGALEAASIEGGAIQTLGLGVSSFSYSPDAATIAFISTQPVARALVTAPVAGGAATTVASDVASFQFAGDGLVFTRTSGALGVSPPAGPAVQLASSVFAYQVAGGSVLFLDGSRQLAIAPAATGAATVLASDVDLGSSYSFASMSPGGTRVAFVRDGIVSTVPAAGGAVTPHVRSAPGSFSWVGDGSLVVTRTNATAPYRFQNGLYVSAVP